MNDLVLSPLAMMERMDSDDLCLNCNWKLCCSKTDCVFICKGHISFNKGKIYGGFSPGMPNTSEIQAKLARICT